LGAALRQRGFDVTGISRRAPPPGVCDRHIAHDLAAPLPQTLGRFDVVIHAAALASPWAHPRAYDANNIAATRHVLAAARAAPPRRFVFISSSAVHYAYRDQAGIRADDPFPGPPVNLYAASKRAGEDLVRASDLNWTILRPRAVFGPGDTVVFPRILHAARVGVLPELVRTGGVIPRADLIFVDNLVHWIGEAAVRNAGGTFVLTNNEPVAIPDMLAMVLDGLGLAPKRRRVPVGLAMAAAGVMEINSRLFQNWREPAATCFGVASLAFTKTFDIAPTIAAFGPPPISLADGMAAFIAWQKPLL
jgi:2-alkyl-3-oxoalkanoate reductase